MSKYLRRPYLLFRGRRCKCWR